MSMLTIYCTLFLDSKEKNLQLGIELRTRLLQISKPGTRILKLGLRDGKTGKKFYNLQITAYTATT